MDKLIKLFPFLPAEQDVGKLVLALIFYLVVIPIINITVGAILGITIILMPVAFITGSFFGIYGMLGIVFSVLSFMGKLK